MSELTASLSLADRWTIFCQKFSADLFPAHRCPSIKSLKKLECASMNNQTFLANKMNCM